MKINEIEPDINQPRKVFDDEKLEELSESIKVHGVLQPIIVTKKEDYYQIIAGERRWRASKKAGLKTIPVIVRDYDEKKIREVSLIENLQRQDLNALDTARAIKELMEEHQLTQEQLAKTLGKSRSSIARTLASIESPQKQYKLAMDIINLDLSVREAENIAKEEKVETKKKPTTKKKSKLEIIYKDLENRLKNVLGTKVAFKPQTKSRGKIVIDYYTDDELERILEILEK